MESDLPNITVSTPETARDRIARVLESAKRDNALLRIRIPVTVYSYGENRNYMEVPDSSWNLQLPATTTPEQVLGLIEAIGKCISAIAVDGAAEVLRRLTVPAEIPVETRPGDAPLA